MIATKEILKARETAEGSGARVKRLFPSGQGDFHDPFVLLDEFFVDADAGFPDHPHRGFEAITYMKEGSFRHRDNLGNDRELGPGGVQRFTAGKGIVHAEMPGHGSVNRGFQLWINLPQRLKQTEPSYQAVESDKIPELRKNGTRVRTIVGPGSPVRLNTDVLIQDITLSSGMKYKIALPEGMWGFVYVYAGRVDMLELEVRKGEAITIERGDHVEASTTNPAGILLVAGRPAGEPIRLNGSFVE
ncbi:MAG: pirin family protein [Chitinivibrionales bacterium]|nr:pirin family protein [Chitinivibrionales bacterium]MBD3396233.1 pirin family protein [Chitinivibrionales bacterium]